MADNMISAALSRQKGLMKELTSLANNIANADTAGYRGEGVMFSEYVKALEGSDSLSMTRAHARTIDLTQGDIITTNGTFDLAISGEGFFLVETPEGSRLTRAGAFTTNELGELVDGEGRRVLNNGEGPIAIPEGVSSVSVNSEGDVVA
ncbi:MAG: flagellar hook-basal body complex protein, partial [Pseudomonadota bacterium]